MSSTNGDVSKEKPKETAVDRLKRRISDRIDADKDKPRQYRRSQTGLADKIGINKATLNELLNGPSSHRGLLAHLDKIADYFGVPASLLVHRNDTAMMELQQGEYRILQHWRTFPPDVQDRIEDLFTYFAGLLPEEKEQRRIWVQWSRLDPKDRTRIEDQMRIALQARRLERTRPAATDQPPAAGEATGSTAPPSTAKRRTGR